MKPGRLLLAACVAPVLLYYLLTPGLFGSKAQGDGYFGFHYLPALLLHGTTDMAPSSPQAAEYFDRGPTGRLVNRNPIGPALVMLPVYALTLVPEALARWLWPSLPALRGPPYAVNEMQVFWCGLCSLAAGLLGLGVLHRLLARHFPAPAAAAGTLCALYGTPLFWYLTVQPHYQHGLAFAAVTLLIERWDAGRGALCGRRFLTLGLLGGLAMLLRPQEAVFLLAPALELALALRRRPRAALQGAALLALGALLAFSPQLWVWARGFGWLRRPTTVELLRPDAPALLEVLFSTRCGLLPWTPLCYLALPGLLGAALRGPLRLLAGALLLVFCADVALVACSFTWYGAFGFGCRRLSDCAPLFALGLAALLAPRRRGAFWGLGAALGLLCALNLCLVDLQRRRALPSSGSSARPAFRWAEAAGAPPWLQRLLRRGYPFAQPAGLWFALRHRAPITAFEGVVGNYALEREAHDFSVIGDRWPLWGDRDYVLERPGPQGGRLRVLLQFFAREPVEAAFLGRFPAGAARVLWDGQPLAVDAQAEALRFQVPAAWVTAHRVVELVLEVPAGAELRELTLRSTTRWWRGGPVEAPRLQLPTRR